MRAQLSAVLFVGLSFAGVADAAVQGVTVVSPAELLNTDGPSFVTPAAFSVHYQQIYQSSLFSALPQGGGLLKDVAFRVDAPSGGRWTTSKDGIQVTVSTFAHGSLSPIFAKNIGADAFRLIDASQTVILNSGWIDPFTPALFEIAFGNARGFHYDPSLGDLLVDVTGLSVPLLLDSYVGTTTTAVWQSAQDLNSPEGRLMTEGLVTLFRFAVPEPSSYALLALGVGALLLIRCSRLQQGRRNSWSNPSIATVGSDVTRLKAPTPLQFLNPHSASEAFNNTTMAGAPVFGANLDATPVVSFNELIKSIDDVYCL